MGTWDTNLSSPASLAKFSKRRETNGILKKLARPVNIVEMFVM